MQILFTVYISYDHTSDQCNFIIYCGESVFEVFFVIGLDCYL